jgi:uncharacterized protein
MNQQHYFVRLIPPRPTFPFDMTEDEKRLMKEHVAYMQAHFQAGAVVIYGPVLAAEAPFGMGVIQAVDEVAAREILDGDPTVRMGLNRYELSPMRVGAARGI